jgi:cytochrome oxidase Cu insertion factor (SCO1/SenC/PrrC family)
MGQQSDIKAKSRWSFAYGDSVNNTFTGTAYVPFDITTLDGKLITTESSKGKITIFCFWFEGCTGCRAEVNELNALYDSLKNNPGYQFAAITFDDKESLPGFVTKYNIHYPIATVDKEDEFKRLNYHNGCPSLLILDKEERIQFEKDFF